MSVAAVCMKGMPLVVYPETFWEAQSKAEHVIRNTVTRVIRGSQGGFPLASFSAPVAIAVGDSLRKSSCYRVTLYSSNK